MATVGFKGLNLPYDEQTKNVMGQHSFPPAELVGAPRPELKFLTHIPIPSHVKSVEVAKFDTLTQQDQIINRQGHPTPLHPKGRGL